jgi:hypothetical protein
LTNLKFKDIQDLEKLFKKIKTSKDFQDAQEPCSYSQCPAFPIKNYTENLDLTPELMSQ